jgi:hypothetical protein
MTPALIAGIVSVGGFGLAALVAWRLASRTGLGLAHPGVAFLVTHGVLFGAGGLALAVADGRAGAAAYTGAAMFAFGLGLAVSAWIAERRAAVEAGGRRAPGSAPAPRPPPGVRLGLAVAMAIGSIALLLPLVARSGLPFLAGDITGARAEIAGLVIQPLRVAAPALAIILVLRAASGDAGRRLVGLAVVAGIAAFELLLASRYLLAELLVAIALAWLIAGRLIQVRTLVALAAVGLVMFGALQLVRTYDQARGQELEFAVRRTVNRVVLVQPRTLDALMTVIPAEQPHFAGGTWFRRLAPALGQEPAPNLGYWIYDRVVAGPQTTAGYAAPGLLGEAWANFGWLGLAIFGGLGVVVERFGALLAVRRTIVADVAAAGLVTLFVARTHALGLVGLGILVVLVAAWRLVAAPDAGLARAIATTLRWRPPAPPAPA